MKHEIINDDCLRYLDSIVGTGRRWDTAFADPPDNIALAYNTYQDMLSPAEYTQQMREWIVAFLSVADTVWVSYNSRWSFDVGAIVRDLLACRPALSAKACVQTFTFGQHNQHDLGNNYRPLLRLQRSVAPLFPDAVRVPSWRQENGDKRADPRGRVPGDVFDFPRVTGNSKQRRPWHPTQLHEGLVERCLRLTTPPGGSVLDPFGGTGTVMRVCNKLGLDSTTIEIDREYCTYIEKDFLMGPVE